jgi:hypothetical protein
MLFKPISFLKVKNLNLFSLQITLNVHNARWRTRLLLQQLPEKQQTNGLEYYDLFESDFFIYVVCHFLIIVTLKGTNYNGQPSFIPWFISIDSSFLQIFSLRTAIFVCRYTIFNSIIKSCGEPLSIIIWQSRLL